MRIFGSDRMDGMLQRLGLKEGEAIVHPWINKALEKAQQKVEARNFEIRKNLLKFDDVMNDQRKVVYEQRRELIDAEDVADTVRDMRHQSIDELVTAHMPEKAYPEQWDVDGLTADVSALLDLDLPIADWAKEEGIAEEELRARVTEASDRLWREKVATYGEEPMRGARRTSCCRSSTTSGRSICSTSTICGRASICAATASATRSTSTSARPSTCSRAC